MESDESVPVLCMERLGMESVDTIDVGCKAGIEWAASLGEGIKSGIQDTL